jgi:hypothetical protein
MVRGWTLKAMVLLLAVCVAGWFWVRTEQPAERTILPPETPLVPPGELGGFSPLEYSTAQQAAPSVIVEPPVPVPRECEPLDYSSAQQAASAVVVEPRTFIRVEWDKWERRRFDKPGKWMPVEIIGPPE